MEGSISTEMGNIPLFQYYCFTTEEIKQEHCIYANVQTET
jgi:hypothetical protein